MLTELSKDKYPSIQNFFRITSPNAALIFSILEHKAAGRIWLNCSQDACLLITGFPFCFVSGNITSSFLHDCTSLLKTIKPSSIIIPCNDLQYFSKNNIPHKRRVHFSGKYYEIKSVSIKLKDDYRLVRIDENNFDHCNWKEKLLDFYGTKSNFLNNSFGYALWNCNQMICEVYGVISNNYFEIGAYTAPEYRSRGLLNYLIFASLPEFCAINNLVITASCEEENRASAKTSLRIGLRQDYFYEILDISSFNFF